MSEEPELSCIARLQRWEEWLEHGIHADQSRDRRTDDNKTDQGCAEHTTSYQHGLKSNADRNASRTHQRRMCQASF